jgi:hypothetical protein
MTVGAIDAEFARREARRTVEYRLEPETPGCDAFAIANQVID